MPRKLLLSCGIVAALLYVAMNVIGLLQDPSQGVMTHTISELSAIGAPSRPTWVVLGVFYNLLMIAFGIGVRAAGRKRTLRASGALIVVAAIFGFFWPPMHQRGDEISLTDTLHIVWTAVHNLLSLAAMALAAFALGKRFRWFTLVTIAVMLLCGALTSLQAPDVPLDLPTPTIGLWERAILAANLAWLVTLSIALLNRTHQPTEAGPEMPVVDGMR